MALDLANKARVDALVGHSVLFIGNECRYWSLQQIQSAARTARSMGFDSICPKRLNGTQIWSGTIDQIATEHQACNDVGVGYIPMAYSYGPSISPNFHQQEAALYRETMAALRKGSEPGFICVDMETEWNGRVDAAANFAQIMAPGDDLLYVTSWANPLWQNWGQVLDILRSCMNCYVPQVYDDSLLTLEEQQIPADLAVQPAVDLTLEFGANHPLSIALQEKARGAKTVWAWEYLPALQNRFLAHQVAGSMR